MIDSSRLKTLTNCERMSYFEYIRNWKIDVFNNDLGFGSAIHKGMEFILSRWEHFKIHPSFLFELKTSLAARLDYSDILENISRNYPFVKKLFKIIEQEYIKEGFDGYNYFPKNLERGKTALLYFIEENRHRNFIPFEIDNRKALEIGGTVDFFGTELTFRGDAILSEDNGKTYGNYEWKTGKDFYNWENNWSMDIQMGMYNYASEKLLKEKFKPVIVSGILFRNLQYDYKKDKLDPFRHFALKEVVTRWDEIEKARWIASITQKITMLKFHMRQEYWPMRESQCSSFFGRTCDFKTICENFPELEKLKNPPVHFIEKEWNPLEDCEFVVNV